MAKDHPEAVRRGLQLKKAGNAILSMVGGREIHPINVRVGGFYRAPTRSELRGLLPQLEQGEGDSPGNRALGGGLSLSGLGAGL